MHNSVSHQKASLFCHCLQTTYLADRNATEVEFEYTEAQFYQSVYSCDDVPYYDNSTSMRC